VFTEFSEERRRRRLNRGTSVAAMVYCDLLDVLKARRKWFDGPCPNLVQSELTDPQITLRNRTMTFRQLLHPYDNGRVRTAAEIWKQSTLIESLFRQSVGQKLQRFTQNPANHLPTRRRRQFPISQVPLLCP
jgi:hypothetical protein